jgi:hypothetical protein
LQIWQSSTINGKLAPFIRAPHIPHGLQSEYCSTGQQLQPMSVK